MPYMKIIKNNREYLEKNARWFKEFFSSGKKREEKISSRKSKSIILNMKAQPPKN